MLDIVNISTKSICSELTMRTKDIVVVIFALLSIFFECSNCHFVEKNIFVNLKNSKNVQLEVYTIDGLSYTTCNFFIKSDTLIIKDHVTPFNTSALRVPINAIKNVRYCKLGEKGADYRGLIFTAILLGIVLLLPARAFSPGG
jgi:hypothetical protein